MAKTEKTLLSTMKDSEASTSIIFGAIVVVVVGLLIFNFMKSSNTAQVTPTGLTSEQSPSVPNENGFIPPSSLPTEHIVSKGEHLWGIAEKYYGSGFNYVDIQSANPDSKKRLEVGAKLTIPAVTAKKSTVATVALEKSSNATVSTASITGESYIVQKSDSLWSIAVRAYGDGYKWTSIFNANKDVIKEPGQIEIGWSIKLPR